MNKTSSRQTSDLVTNHNETARHDQPLVTSNPIEAPTMNKTSGRQTSGLEIKSRVKAGDLLPPGPCHVTNHNETVLRAARRLRIKSGVKAGPCSMCITNHNETLLAVR